MKHLFGGTANNSQISETCDEESQTWHDLKKNKNNKLKKRLLKRLKESKSTSELYLVTFHHCSSCSLEVYILWKNVVKIYYEVMFGL